MMNSYLYLAKMLDFDVNMIFISFVLNKCILDAFLSFKKMLANKSIK